MSAPHYDGTDPSRQECVEFIDALINGRLPQEPELQTTVSIFQSHSHTFTCRKKCRIIKIRSKEGHGKDDGVKRGAEIVLNSCRFKFPKYPMPRTMIIDAPPPDTDPHELQHWKENYI